MPNKSNARPIIRRLLVVPLAAVALGGPYYVFSRLGWSGVPVVKQKTPTLPESVRGPSTGAALEHGGRLPTLTARSNGSISTSEGAAKGGGASSLGTAAFDITIDGAHPMTTSVIRVNKDDRVSLVVTSDRTGVLEVHGYNEAVKVESGGKVALSFVAAKSGRFPIDLHARNGVHLEIAALEVLPR